MYKLIFTFDLRPTWSGSDTSKNKQKKEERCHTKSFFSCLLRLRPYHVHRPTHDRLWTHTHIGRPVCLHPHSQTHAQKDFISLLLVVCNLIVCTCLCAYTHVLTQLAGKMLFRRRRVVWNLNVCTWCTWVCPRGCVCVCVCSFLCECVYVLKMFCLTGLCVY